MITNKDIQVLAELARLEVSSDECEVYSQDFDGVMSYIDTLSQVDVTLGGQDSYVLSNVVREDELAYEPGEFTDLLLKEAPDSKDGYLKVPKIL